MSNFEPVIVSDGGDDSPPAWMTEDPHWADNFNLESSAWEDEPLLTDEDITPELIAPYVDAGATASYVPHYIGDAEDFEIFYMDKLKPFADAKNASLQRAALARKGKGSK